MYNYFKNLEKKPSNLEFRFKTIDETRNCLLEGIKHNILIIKKHKNICKTLIYIEHLLILACTLTNLVSIFAFSSLLGIPKGITSSAIGLTICAVTTKIKKNKTRLKKKKKNMIK